MASQAVIIPVRDRWPDVENVPAYNWRSVIAEVATRRIVRDLPLRLDLNGIRVLGAGSMDDPTITVNDPRAFFARVGRNGLIGFGESYMAGEWDAADAETLTAALTVFGRHVNTLVPRSWECLRGFALERLPAETRESRTASKQDIAAHYDLSNDLSASFLDASMTYSCALFNDTTSAGWLDLPAAQHAKIDRLLDRIGVGPHTHLLEIGTGWGELAIRAAKRGARVTTLTLSERQAELARTRLADAGLADRVTVRLQDYRDAAGQYDAIVSVEMIEAVGYDQWPTYFQALERLLAPRGRIGLQAITMPDDRLERTRNTHGWIHKYIFPGGLLPSTEAIERTVANRTGLKIHEQLAFGGHYATTLRLWQESFDANWDKLSHDFDETFRRMWRFYLCYTRAGFESQYLNVHQYVMVKP
jgi:cyclopropane-fatty-acyl-phospholipid synthase